MSEQEQFWGPLQVHLEPQEQAIFRYSSFEVRIIANRMYSKYFDEVICFNYCEQTTRRERSMFYIWESSDGYIIIAAQSHHATHHWYNCPPTVWGMSMLKAYHYLEQNGQLDPTEANDWEETMWGFDKVLVYS